MTAIAVRIPEQAAVVPNATVLALLQQPFVTAVLVTAIAYLIGASVFVISRLLIDTLSALTLRPLFLKLYRWNDFKEMGPRAINQKYRLAIEKVLKRPKEDAVREEVTRRRQRGRLIRTMVVPVALWASPTISEGIVLLIGIISAYAYAELSIYQEARLAT